MKRLTQNIILVLLVLAFTQCRKGIDPVYDIPQNGGTVKLTLKAGSGGTGSRTDITEPDPSDGTLTVKWSADDKIYVAGLKDGYLGTLDIVDHDGVYGTEETFTGNIKKITPQTLYFYYLGKNYDLNVDDPDNPTKFNIQFTNQATNDLGDIPNYCHIACGSKDNVNLSQISDLSDLNVTLNPMMSICKFDLSVFDASSDVKVYGTDVYTQGEIDFKNGKFYGISTGQASNYASGINITTAASGNENWYVALIPPPASATYPNIPTLPTALILEGVKNNNNAKYVFYVENFNGQFYTATGNGIPSVPGAVKGLFSVADGKQVRFSQGNLQYQASDNKWRFAENQYDIIGNASGNDTKIENGRSTQSDWIDLFGWGTSGYDDKYPWMVSGVYGDGDNDIANTDYDWGQYIGSSIINGGGNTWRTLTAKEWGYLINRTDKRSICEVNGKTCLVLIPDGEWSAPKTCSFTANELNIGKNVYSITQALLMQGAGAVFLPMGGNFAYDDHTGAVTIEEATTSGYYWTSSKCLDEGILNKDTYAQKFGIILEGSSGYNIDIEDDERCLGCSVRLVMDVTP